MIGITLGEYCGIGPEILLKTYAELRDQFPPSVIYGSEQLLKKFAADLDIPEFWKESSHQLVETFTSPIAPGDKKARAEYVLSTLNQSVTDSLNQKISAIVTCPIDKSVIQYLLPNFTGHTEYLAEKSGVGRTVMVLDNRDFSIALLSNHVSLRNVSQTLTSFSIEEVIRAAAKSYSMHFHIRSPKMAVLGLNPHAGELDPNSEEKNTFGPVIEKLKSDGFDIWGPYPSDSFFPKAKNQGWNLVFSPFHDQGLVAAKYNGLENVVNITLGMPFLRVSPGHGTAYDIVGKNLADHRSFKRALLVAHKHSLNM